MKKIALSLLCFSLLASFGIKSMETEKTSLRKRVNKTEKIKKHKKKENKIIQEDEETSWIDYIPVEELLPCFCIIPIGLFLFLDK